MTPEELEKFYAYGFMLYSQGSCKESSDVFRVLCTNSPLEFRFWFGLGASLQETKEYTEALRAWAVAALLEKESPFPHFHAAECYFSERTPEEAKKALEEVERRIDEQHPLFEKVALLKERWA